MSNNDDVEILAGGCTLAFITMAALTFLAVASGLIAFTIKVVQWGLS